MNTRKRPWRSVIFAALLLFLSLCMPVMAASDDNSLSSLNIHNGTLSRDFRYDIWEYDVTVEPGTYELLLEPTTSNPNASITSITGTVLEDGKATVLINTMSESGIPMTYTLHVTEDGAGAAAETEASQTETEAPQTETQAPQTEPETEAPQTEAQTEVHAANALQEQVAKLKSDSDLMLKIVYGLIAFCVILLVFIINLILKNRDLKDDLKDAEDQLTYQTNEFARKERMMATDTYYAPTQQEGAAPGMEQASAGTAQGDPAVEETFGARTTAPVGYQGMQPEDVPPQRPITEEPAPQPVQQPETVPAAKPADVPEQESGSDVNITMVEL